MKVPRGCVQHYTSLGARFPKSGEACSTPPLAVLQKHLNVARRHKAARGWKPALLAPACSKEPLVGALIFSIIVTPLPVNTNFPYDVIRVLWGPANGIRYKPRV